MLQMTISYDIGHVPLLISLPFSSMANIKYVNPDHVLLKCCNNHIYAAVMEHVIHLISDQKINSKALHGNGIVSRNCIFLERYPFREENGSGSNRHSSF
jgi:hypothetical protein